MSIDEWANLIIIVLYLIAQKQPWILCCGCGIFWILLVVLIMAFVRGGYDLPSPTLH